jgi:ribonuclease HI/pterin-4a-carbinolamine dehydratase
MWQETKRGLFKQFVFNDIDQTRLFIGESLKIAKKWQYYFRLEVEYKMVQIWLTNNGKIEQNQITQQIAESIDALLDTELIKNYDNDDINSKLDPNSNLNKNKENNNLKYLKLYTDGGSRGNPGPSSSGYVIFDQNDNIIEQKGVYLGVTTNNQAEYTALKLGLERCLSLGSINVDVFMDSLLVVNQMNGIFKIRNRDLWPIHDNIKKIITKFKKVKFQHVPRELNKLADAEVNKALDSKLSI